MWRLVCHSYVTSFVLVSGSVRRRRRKVVVGVGTGLEAFTDVGRLRSFFFRSGE